MSTAYLKDEIIVIAKKMRMTHVRSICRSLSILWSASTTFQEFEDALPYVPHEKCVLLKTALLEFKSQLEDRKRFLANLKAAEKVSKKRKNKEDMFQQVAAKRQKKLEGLDDPHQFDFPDIVDEDEQYNRLQLFNDSLCDSVMQQVVCASCAGIYDLGDTKSLDLCNIPNQHCLIPYTAHPRHELKNGMLLYPKAVLRNSDGLDFAHFCKICLDNLKRDRTPPLALCNNMWIGPVPDELSILTIPERLLVSLYYPFAYIVKLYPKSPNARCWKDWDVNFGVRGNVSTYKLDRHGIEDMIQGNLMPHPPEILASVFSVTLVGPKGRPDRTLQGLCQVRRQRVLDALLWLKENNRLYKDITIDLAVLDRLPDSGIPLSIEHNIKHVNESLDVNENSVFMRGSDVDDDDDDDGELQPEHINSFQSRDITSDLMNINEPAVFPLQESALVDVDGSGLDDTQLLQSALMNTDRMCTNDEPAYAIVRGNCFVNEYSRKNEFGDEVSISKNEPNHLLGAFPWLFPYGEGGFETERKYRVAYSLHSQWALRYADGRFAKNINFIAQIFGVMQKRQVSLGADLQIKRKDFRNHEQSIRSIKPSDLKKAVEEERRGEIPSSAAVRALKSFVKATRKHVAGTNENRISTRSKIHGMTLMLNPPNIWLTVTFDDVNDPLVQLYAGVDLSLDKFDASMGPDKRQRLKTSTENPVAATKFFYRMMLLLFEKLLGISVNERGSIQRERGILGFVEGYLGMVEAQNRRSLHAHTLIWLRGSPSASEMVEKLRDESFRNQLEQFIARNIKGHVPGLNEEYITTETPAQRKISKDIASAFNKPIEPRSPDFHARLRETEFALARTLQTHKCRIGTCKIPDKHNRIHCKRHAPWDLSPRDIVYESGLWYAKREYGYLNTWNPIILLAARSNSDMKLLTNANDTRHITWYNTKYMSKVPLSHYQTSAVLSERLSYIRNSPSDDTSLRKSNARLLSQCAHALSRNQELSNQQMVSYLMGYGDKLMSHRFVSIYLSGALWVLQNSFPEFNKRSHAASDVDSTSNNNFDEYDNVHDVLSTFSLRMSPDGLHVKNQLSDYIYRGDNLENFSFLDFLLETYEPQDHTLDEDRYRHQRVPYKPDSPNHKGRVRILRKNDACMIPDFLGSWVPRNDREEDYDYYCAVILMVLKPWRSLLDLKGCSSWSASFDEFFQTTHARNIRLISNFQFYYQSSDTARSKRDDEKTHHDVFCNDERNEEFVDPPSLPPGVFKTSDGFLNVDFNTVAESKESDREIFHGTQAVRIAQSFGIFASDNDNENWTINSPHTKKADYDLLTQNIHWQHLLHTDNKNEDVVDPNISRVPGSSVTFLDSINVNPQSSFVQTITSSTELSDCYDLFETLTNDQRRACTIVDKHLSSRLSNQPVSPLHMIISGSGGVGKSTVIRTIQQIFDRRKASDLLAVTATSGVAACHVNGTTLHWWAGIPVPLPKDPNFTQNKDDARRARRRRNISNKQYLIIDEVSMLCLDTLGVVSFIIAETHSKSIDKDLPFGGNFDVILIGDFHQFPPPLRSHLALYKTEHNSSLSPSPWRYIGKTAMDCFRTVVLLTEQMRVIDPDWSAVLERIRDGGCTASDIRVIRSLVLNTDEHTVPDFSQPPWSEAILVTPRHGVRNRWNDESVKKYARLNNKRLFISPAEHLLNNGEPLDPTKNTDVFLAIADKDKNLSKTLPRNLYLAEGLRILITFNVSVTSDLANGTQGIITDIFLDPREPSIPPSSHVHELKFPPRLIYFKPDLCNVPALPGLPQGVIPIEPSVRRFIVKLDDGKKISVSRRQYPTTPAYCLTDYKAQGQTLQPVILDLRTPPSGCLTQCSLYVALSRGVSRKYTRILTDPHQRLFTIPPDEDLRNFDHLLNHLNNLTISNLSI